MRCKLGRAEGNQRIRRGPVGPPANVDTFRRDMLDKSTIDILNIVGVIRIAAARAPPRSVNSTLFARGQQRCGH